MKVTISLELFILVNVVYLLVGVFIGRSIIHYEEKHQDQSKWKK